MAETPPKIKVGAFTIAFLADGLWRNDGGCMFGVVPRELWKRNHPPDERNRIRLNLTCPLIMRGNDAILVDTGIGNRLSDVERTIFDHGDGWLPGHIRALGIEPGDITALIVSKPRFRAREFLSSAESSRSPTTRRASVSTPHIGTPAKS